MPQLAMQELDDGIRQALPVVHLEASELVPPAQICGDSQSVGCGIGWGWRPALHSWVPGSRPLPELLEITSQS